MARMEVIHRGHVMLLHMFHVFLNVNIVELRFLERGEVMAVMVVEIDNYYVSGFLSQF